MAWFAVLDTRTGRLHTIAEDPSGFPPGFTTQALARKPDFETHEWNGTDFVTRPVPVVWDRLADILADAEMPALTAANRTRLRTVLDRHIGPLDPDWKRYTK